MCKTLLFIALIILLLGSSALAQAKRKPRVAPKQKPVPTQTTTTEVKIETPAVSAPAKKNERTETAQNQTQDAATPQKKNSNRGERGVNNSPAAMPFAYEFSQPQFVISKVIIEHDVDGKGKITFEKQNVGEPVSDPIEISPKSLENIQRLWTELNFLDSTEDYQSTKYKYPHLGVMKLRQEQNGKKREATFDWTENKAAKELTEEYKKLTEQFIWLFEMNLARENQPLSAPQLVDRFESLLRRNQISDPQQMLPYLREVSDDERLPLIARNHTAKMIKNIEKPERTKVK